MIGSYKTLSDPLSDLFTWVIFILITFLGVPLQFCDADDSSPSALSIVENSPESGNDNLGDLKLVPVLKEKQQQLSKSQKRRQANKSLSSTESNISTEAKVLVEIATTISMKPNTFIQPVETAAKTLNFNRLKTTPRKSVSVIDGQKVASNDEYFLVCPKDKLCLLSAEGKEYFSVEREFNVSDICWSVYLKQFLILSDEDLYSLDSTRQTPLMIEISNFADNMDECTCYDNIFMVISDYGGSTIEVWDIEMNWKLIKRYEQPISRKRDQGICSIRFSSSGMYLGVTLTEPFIEKAYFQLRNWKDMTVLQTVGQPFYDGYCDHYMLALPNEEFLVYKYSERKMFFFGLNGQRKQTIQYARRICSTALVTKGQNCLIVQTSRPDQVHFYDL